MTSSQLSIDDVTRRAKSVIPTMRVNLDSAQLKGVRNIINALKSGGLSVGIGPPGTGKTVVFNITHFDIVDHMDKNEIILYVAPTNRLVEECSLRTAALLLLKGYTMSDLRNILRIYGSRFKPDKLHEDVKIVFTTPYQPGALKYLLKIKNTVHLMIDEASTTPLHGPFIEIAMTMAEAIRKKRVEWLRSFSVIGDPMQAIVEEYTFPEKLKYLIVGRLLTKPLPPYELDVIKQDPALIFQYAPDHFNALGVKYFFLDKTYRIPNPSELIVSEPFYHGLLKGVPSCKERLRDIKDEKQDIISIIRSKRRLLKDPIINTAVNALDSQIPVIYIKDRGPSYAYKIPIRGEIYSPKRRPAEIDELDIVRARLAAEIAAFLCATTQDNIKIEVLTPYIEMKTQIQLYLREIFSEKSTMNIEHRLRTSTIHSALGSEADVVVVTMGKEYRGKSEDEFTRTIYFHTPELVNIQFSRHRRLLVIIGDIERLAKNFKKERYFTSISKLANVIKDLKERGFVITTTIGD